MPIDTSVATDIANAVLDFHVRGPALMQTMQERPLLAWLSSGEKPFSGGETYVTEPVQGAVMNDTAGFFAGYSEDDALTFRQAGSIRRARYPWKEVHAGFIITHTELKKDGITVTDGETSTSQHSELEITRLTALLENRLADFSESWARAVNEMYWNDGSQDAKQIPGIRALLTDEVATGVVGNIDKATTTWWRNRVRLDLAPSPENQTLSKFLRKEIIQLTRYGGKPNKAFCGSDFWGALMDEVEKKGIYTQTGFAGRTTDIGLNKIAIQGIGTFEYDPTLDSMGRSRYCYVLDSRAIKSRPMEGEKNRTVAPARPYDYMVMLRSMVSTGALTAKQLNGCAVYAINAG